MRKQDLDPQDAVNQPIHGRSRSSSMVAGSAAVENQLVPYGARPQTIDRNQIRYLKLRARLITALLQDISNFIESSKGNSDPQVIKDHQAAKKLHAYVLHASEDPEVSSSKILDMVNSCIIENMVMQQQHQQVKQSTTTFTTTTTITNTESPVRSLFGNILFEAIKPFSYSDFEDARQKDWSDLNASLLADRSNGVSSHADPKNSFMNLVERTDVLNRKILELEKELAKERADLELSTCGIY